MPATRSAPVIGICAVMERARWAVWDLPAALVPMNYIEQVQNAGGVALLIPPDPSLVEDPGRVLDRIDGLMLVGGPDVEAARYGAAPHPAAEPPVPLRDAVEIALIAGRHRARAAGARDLPRDAGDQRGPRRHDPAAPSGGARGRRAPAHRGELRRQRAPGHVRRGLARRGGGRDGPAVASHHHQAVGDLGEGLRVTGWHEADGVAEALEGDDAVWLVGVQWHPEVDPGSPVIAALVAAADQGRREGWDRREGGDSSIPAARPGERS